jgi:cold shock CspA family protein
MRGVIVQWSAKFGYGFLRPAGTRNHVYFRLEDTVETGTLEVDSAVEFSLIRDPLKPGKLRARNVRTI